MINKDLIDKGTRAANRTWMERNVPEPANGIPMPCFEVAAVSSSSVTLDRRVSSGYTASLYGTTQHFKIPPDHIPHWAALIGKVICLDIVNRQLIVKDD